jgi:hypothetical protein
MERRTLASAVLAIATLSILVTATATASASASVVVSATATAIATAAPTSSAAIALPADAPAATEFVPSGFQAASELAASQRSAPDTGDGLPHVKRMPAERPDLRDLAPGDRTQWAAEITNTGAPGTLGVEFVTHGGSSMMSRQGNGLRMIVDFCSTPLASSYTAGGAMVFDCTAEQSRLGTVTSAATQLLTAQDIVDTGETVGVRVMISFPLTADNTFEDSSAAIDVVYTITPLGESVARVEPAAPAEAELARAVFPGILATGISVMFMSLAAAVIISLGILLLALVPRGAREGGDEDS